MIDKYVGKCIRVYITKIVVNFAILTYLNPKQNLCEILIENIPKKFKAFLYFCCPKKIIFRKKKYSWP